MNRIYFFAEAFALAVLVGVLVGVLGGYYFFRPEPPKPETYASETRQKDDSLVLERKPMKDAKPPHMIPPGSKVERVVQVTVQPELDIAGQPDSSLSCPPVTVDMTLVELKDKSHKVIASSPDGRVVGGVDIPVFSGPEFKEPKWIIGAGANPIERDWMVKASRRVIGPFFAGAMYMHRKEASEVWGIVELVY